MLPFKSMADFLLPVLQSLNDQPPLRRDEIASRVARLLSLKEEEISERTNRGDKTKLQDRVHWAAYYLNRAGLIVLAAGKFEITETGRQYLKREKTSITKDDLREFPAFLEFLANARKHKQGEDTVSSFQPDELSEGSSTPVEVIRNSLAEIEQQLNDELLQQILDKDPKFFEHLVKDLLVKMGYGWSPVAGEVVGGSGDGGIDVVLSP